MLKSFGDLKSGKNTICEIDGKYPEMKMDIDVLKLEKGTFFKLFNEEKEMAVLLLTGEIMLEFNGKTKYLKRNSVFDEYPSCLHVPRKTEVIVTASQATEVLVQCTQNEQNFEAKLYLPGDCKNEIFGDGEWGGTARRIVRTMFDYNNAPYSNMVMGEVITFPGKWSSYPPHFHPQPEVYYYKFDKPEGFGLCLIGDEACKITDNSFAIIKGGVHPQTAAPGYAMYYCWMIRHFDGNPWKDRIVAEEHRWLLEKDCRIWPEK